jgi:hypothetical protein
MLLVGSVAASAAQFEVVSGEGSMNHGLGFRPVTGRVAVQPGSTLHVPPGSQAFLVYDNGCRVRVTPGAFVRVQKNAPCDASGRDLPAPGATDAQGLGGQQQQDPGIDPLTLGATVLIGGALLTGGIIAVNNSNKNTPITSLSP